MKLTKNNRMYLVAAFILLAVYNVVVFVLPFKKTDGFWVGYSFTMVALLIAAAVTFFAINREGAKSRFYGWPIATVAWRYLTVQLIVGSLEILIPNIPYRYEIVLNVILLGACLVGLIWVDSAREEIKQVEEVIKEKVFYIRSLQADVEGLLSATNDIALQKMIRELADTIRYSDPMSSPQLAAIENRISGKTEALIADISDPETAKGLCNELQQLFAERNRKCKLLK